MQPEIDIPVPQPTSTTVSKAMSHTLNIKFSLMIVKLKEGKWLRWSQEVMMALRSQCSWGYVTGTEKEPAKDTPERAEWVAAHDQITGVLVTIVEPTLQYKLESITNTHEAWNKLKEKTHSKGIIAKLENLTTTVSPRESLWLESSGNEQMRRVVIMQQVLKCESGLRWLGEELLSSKKSTTTVNI